jgi:hypothetical protein
MEILSRINSNTIDKELYIKYQRNDQDLARHYAFDIAAHNKNKSTLCYDNITYEILGDSFSLAQLQENIEIQVVCDYPLDIRLDKILSKQLSTSREAIKKLGNTGHITGVGIKDIAKAKVKNGMIICINPFKR